jgi:uroporphyrin-3 C-methyltransferase
MSAPDPSFDRAPADASVPGPVPPALPAIAWTKPFALLALAVAVLALVASVMLWQRLSAIQEQLARQSADAGSQSVEARTLAREAQTTAQDLAARLGAAEARFGEVALQRTQLEALMQSLSRSRDDNLVVDIDAAIRLAQQQSELTGSAAPLLAALRSAEQRIARAAQPRLSPVQNALAHDIERVGNATLTDTPGLLARLDTLIRLVDDLPTANRVMPAGALATAPRPAAAADPAAPAPQDASSWWERGLSRAWAVVRDEARSLVRVSRIDRPEAVLLAPDQAFFLRENLKLQLLNARLGLLGRQADSARADLQSASEAIDRYFDLRSPRTQTAMNLIAQARDQLRSTALPRPDDTLSALATAAAGR